MNCFVLVVCVIQQKKQLIFANNCFFQSNTKLTFLFVCKKMLWNYLFLLFFSLRAMCFEERRAFQLKIKQNTRKNGVFALNENHFANLFVWFQQRHAYFSQQQSLYKSYLIQREAERDIYLQIESSFFLFPLNVCFDLLLKTTESFAFLVVFVNVFQQNNRVVCGFRQETTFSSSLFVFLLFCLFSWSKSSFVQTDSSYFKKEVYCFLVVSLQTQTLSKRFLLNLLWLFALCIDLVQTWTIFSREEFHFYSCFRIAARLHDQQTKKKWVICKQTVLFCFLFQVSLSISLSLFVLLLVLQERELFVDLLLISTQQHKEFFWFLIDFEWKKLIFFCFCFENEKIERNSSSFFVWYWVQKRKLTSFQ